MNNDLNLEIDRLNSLLVQRGAPVLIEQVADEIIKLRAAIKYPPRPPRVRVSIGDHHAEVTVDRPYEANQKLLEVAFAAALMQAEKSSLRAAPNATGEILHAAKKVAEYVGNSQPCLRDDLADFIREISKESL